MIAINAAMANQLNEFKASIDKAMEEGISKEEAIFRTLKEAIIALLNPSASKATVIRKNGNKKRPDGD